MDDPHLEDLASQIKEKASAELEQAVGQIENLAQSVDPLKLFCAVVANVAFAPEGTVTEASHGHVPAMVETLAYHLYPFFGDCDNPEITPMHVDKCIDFLNTLISMRLMIGFSPEQEGRAEDEVSAIASFVRMHTEVIRGSAYPEQTAREIKEIQDHFDAWFANSTGITPDRAQALLWAIIRNQEEAFNSTLTEIREELMTAVLSRQEMDQTPASQRTSQGHDLTEDDTGAESTDAQKFMTSLSIAASGAIPVGLGEITELDPCPTAKEWESLIGLVGMTTQSRISMSSPVDVRQRPLFVLPDNRVILVDISNAMDALWEAFEARSRTDQAFYESYQKYRADWLETSVFDSLSSIFPYNSVYQNLRYPDPDKDDGSEAQLDAAVLWGPFVILVEAKANQFRLASQLGDVGRLRTDIKANVEDAFGQATRAAKYINCTPSPVFEESASGRKLGIQKDQMMRTFLITVSLHHLAGLANRLSMLQDLGLFGEGEFPFSISIADLETIARFCDGPDVFLHYIEKRLMTQHEKIDIQADELDLFGAYLQTRLQPSRLWEKDGYKPTAILLAGYSQQFDDWASFQRGDRSNPPKIRLEIPSKIKELLGELRKRDDFDSRGIAFALLDLSDPILAVIAKGFEDLETAQFTTGMFRTLEFTEGDTVISIVATRGGAQDPLPVRTHMRAMVEKYRYKAQKSVAFGVLASDSRRPFECAIWLDWTWQYDAEMEKIIYDEPPLIPAPGTKLPGRNAPCMCGSGRKFKRCCLAKFDVGRRKRPRTS